MKLELAIKLISTTFPFAIFLFNYKTTVENNRIWNALFFRESISHEDHEFDNYEIFLY